MKLKDWMFAHNKTAEDIAYELKVCRTSVFLWMKDAFVPFPKNMQKIIKLTDGKVTPKDFEVK